MTQMIELLLLNRQVEDFPSVPDLLKHQVDEAHQLVALVTRGRR